VRTTKNQNTTFLSTNLAAEFSTLVRIIKEGGLYSGTAPHKTLKPTVAANLTPAAICEALPDIQQDAGGTAVGTLPPQSTLKKRKRGEQGMGKKQRTRQCGRCKRFNGENAYTCTGRGKGGSSLCQYLEPGGSVKIEMVHDYDGKMSRRIV
jgi:hypothetical protein